MSNSNKREINLLKNYPKSKRNVSERGQSKTKEQQELARKFGRDFFDGDRSNGYGGYHYNERFWKNVIPDFVKHYKLKDGDKILDVGCGKGFMLFDFIVVDLVKEDWTLERKVAWDFSKSKTIRNIKMCEVIDRK